MWPKRRRLSSTGNAFRIRPDANKTLRRQHMHSGSGGVLAVSGLARDAEIGERLEQPIDLHGIDVQPSRQFAAADRIRRGRQSLQRGDAVDETLVGLCVELGSHVVTPDAVARREPSTRRLHAMRSANSHRPRIRRGAETGRGGKQVRSVGIAHVAVEKSQVSLEHRMLPLVLPQVRQCCRDLQACRQKQAGADRRMRRDRGPMLRCDPGDATELRDAGVTHLRLKEGDRVPRPAGCRPHTPYTTLRPRRSARDFRVRRERVRRGPPA